MRSDLIGFQIAENRDHQTVSLVLNGDQHNVHAPRTSTFEFCSYLNLYLHPLFFLLILYTVPSEPQNLHSSISYIVPGTVGLWWSQPARPNGIIQYYEVQYVGNETTAETDQENGFSQISSISIIRTYVYITNLIPSSTHSFRVRAVTNIGPGEFTPFISQTTR